MGPLSQGKNSPQNYQMTMNLPFQGKTEDFDEKFALGFRYYDFDLKQESQLA